MYAKYHDDPEMLALVEELWYSIQEVIAMRKNSHPRPADFGTDGA
jgi:hypothetical protein